MTPNKNMIRFLLAVAVATFLVTVPTTDAFSPTMPSLATRTTTATTTISTTSPTSLHVRKIRENDVPVKKIASSRRKKLGIADDEDEYDLEMALDNNTDPIITKIIAGSLIVSIITLLIVGIVIPATTDYGDGVCNTLLTGGRC